jgi:hypothetical protein
MVMGAKGVAPCVTSVFKQVPSCVVLRGPRHRVRPRAVDRKGRAEVADHGSRTPLRGAGGARERSCDAIRAASDVPKLGVERRIDRVRDVVLLERRHDLLDRADHKAGTARVDDVVQGLHLRCAFERECESHGREHHGRGRLIEVHLHRSSPFT